MAETRQGRSARSVAPSSGAGARRNNGWQDRASFYLTGQRMATGLGHVEGLALRAAQFAAYRQLNELRYDFPLILVDGADVRVALRSLSGLIDDLLADVAADADGDRIRHHAIQLEREMRVRAELGVAPLSEVWAASVAALTAADGDEAFADSMTRLTDALTLDGELTDCSIQTPRLVVGHLWRTVQRERMGRLAARIDHLSQALEDILAAEQANAPSGLTGERLAHSLGPVFGAELDVDSLSRILIDNRPRLLLSEVRRARIRGLLEVLTAQRFVPGRGGSTENLYEFHYTNPSAAVAAYHERFAATTELAKTLVIAEMEADGRYREEVHDALFEKWDVEDLDADILAMFPEYLVDVDAEAMRGQDSVVLLEALNAGIPIKALVQVNDLLQASSSRDRDPEAGLSARKLGRYALAAGESFVLQLANAHLYQARERIVAGSTAPGATLFVVYSGDGPWLGDLPPYLASAAATEARVFPMLCYDPSAGDTWADRFSLAGNPQPERDWPVHRLSYEDAGLQRVTVETPFTSADFWAGDSRMLHHLALASAETADGGLVPFAEHIATDPGVWAGELPYVLMTSGEDRLHRVLVDRPLVHRTLRDVEQWHRLQELGGIHNSHVARELARQRALFEEELAKANAAAVGTDARAVATARAAAAGPAVLEDAEDDDLDEPQARDPYLPWIETPRCSTFNECTLINDQMFAYNDNRQAYIADPDAGTFAELVEAAENCQVAIIHPGKPRNPAEPGLEELVKRAAPFA